jgi:hypothetical protein
LNPSALIDGNDLIIKPIKYDFDTLYIWDFLGEDVLKVDKGVRYFATKDKKIYYLTEEDIFEYDIASKTRNA